MTVPQHANATGLRFLWLELTGKCQLECVQCYASSSPTGTDGTMTILDWKGVIDQAAALGTRQVQFIGGEPTLHKALPGLIGHALAAKIEVEVYSNLVHIPESLWDTLSQPGVRLATSFYSDDAREHMLITGRNTLARTQDNITTALDRGIPLRAGMVCVLDGQRLDEGQELLQRLGVTQIGIDRMRLLGRPSRGAPDLTELCGACGRGSAAVLPDGSLTPCPMARNMRGGNVLTTPLVDILTGVTWAQALTLVPDPRMGEECEPEKNSCRPTKQDGRDCPPSEKPACSPRFCNPDFTPPGKK
ncbi:radical SAM/SPASM domain-containing protein [Streptosporangium sp. NPDC020072]|uniref:radical SAM/SPASM domain-containing protein n=1 Tax=Streptosporangium sp. NPDC020072 TaxID=3154788 RepID=UPI0034309A2A